jgi:hypothetical protein
MASIQVNASWANGKTLQEFCKVLQERMKYMNETARDSIAACAINVLKGIRSVVKVAKPAKQKVEVTIDNRLYFSVTTQGGKKIPCLRMKGSNQRYVGNEKLVLAEHPVDAKMWQVFRFQDKLSPKLTTYLIAAPNMASAKNKARKIVSSRIIRFAGLAKRAVSMLMMKTSTKNVNDNVPQRVSQKAKEVTHKEEIVAKANDGNGGKYSLVLVDELNYALSAIKGGRATVDTQMKKAMNKIVSIINQKLKKSGGLLGPHKLETPFPSVRSRKK